MCARLARVAVTATILASINSALAVGPYHFQDLGPGGAYSINSYGQVVGGTGTQEFETGNRSFLFTPSSPRGSIGATIDLGGTGNQVATCINNIGEVTGFGGPDNTAFIWSPTSSNATTGTRTELGLAPNDNGSVATGINNSGEICLFGNAFSYVWKPASPNGAVGGFYLLGTAKPGDNFNIAYGINDYGQVATIAPSDAFLWTPTTPGGTVGTFTDLGVPGYYFYFVNASGHVAGGSYLWKPVNPNGVTGTAQTIDIPIIRGMNSSDALVGYDSSGACYWSSSTGRIDLNSVSDSPVHLSAAYSINDSGEIVGVTSTNHAFLLTVPDPSSAGILVAATWCASCRREKRPAPTGGSNRSAAWTRK
jgi:uncharacterized membrane protein